MKPKLQASRNTWLPVFILITLALVWGTSFILIKKSLDGLPPILFVAIRVAMTGLLFLPILLRHRRRLDWSKWPYLFLVGYLGCLIPFMFYAYAQTKVSSSVAGMINSMTPIFALLIGILIFRLPILWTQILGTLIGLAGAAVLVINESQSSIDIHIGYGLMMVFATFCYGMSVNIVKSNLGKVHSLDISSSSFVMAAVPCLIYVLLPKNILYLTETPEVVTALMYLSLLVVFGTFLATIVFYYLVQLTNAVFATMVAYLMPIVAIFWGVMDGEVLTSMHILGIALILLGVYFVRKKRKVIDSLSS